MRGYCFADNFERLARAEKLAAEKGFTVAQIALAWVLHQDMNLFPIVGSTRISAMKENVAATQIKLTEKECAWLDLAAEEKE